MARKAEEPTQAEIMARAKQLYEEAASNTERPKWDELDPANMWDRCVLDMSTAIARKALKAHRLPRDNPEENRLREMVVAIEDAALERAEATKQARSVVKYWRKRGYEVQAWAERVMPTTPDAAPFEGYAVKSNLVNGLPKEMQCAPLS